jgi:hypothetical protein
MESQKKNDQLLLVAAGAAAFWWFFIRDKNPAPGAAAIAPGEPVSLPVVTTGTPIVALPPATSQIAPTPVMTAIAPVNYNPAAGRCSGIGCLEPYVKYADLSEY